MIIIMQLLGAHAQTLPTPPDFSKRPAISELYGQRILFRYGTPLDQIRWDARQRGFVFNYEEYDSCPASCEYADGRWKRVHPPTSIRVRPRDPDFDVNALADQVPVDSPWRFRFDLDATRGSITAVPTHTKGVDGTYEPVQPILDTVVHLDLQSERDNPPRAKTGMVLSGTVELQDLLRRLLEAESIPMMRVGAGTGQPVYVSLDTLEGLDERPTARDVLQAATDGTWSLSWHGTAYLLRVHQEPDGDYFDPLRRVRKGAYSLPEPSIPVDTP